MTQNQLFIQIWEDRPHVSELSGTALFPRGHAFWHWQFLHVLPKGSYPKWKYEPKNIILGTVDEHTNQDSNPKFKELRQKLTGEYYKEIYHKEFLQ